MRDLPHRGHVVCKWFIHNETEADTSSIKSLTKVDSDGGDNEETVRLTWRLSATYSQPKGN